MTALGLLANLSFTLSIELDAVNLPMASPLFGLLQKAVRRFGEDAAQRLAKGCRQGRRAMELFARAMIRALARRVLGMPWLRAAAVDGGPPENGESGAPGVAPHGADWALAEVDRQARTPSHGLLGMLSLLRETALTAQQQEYLRGAEISALQLLAIIGDAADVSSLEAGRMRLSPQMLDFARLVRDVEARVRAAAQSKGLAFDVTMHPDVPRWLLADPARLRQLLLSVLGHAVAATARGWVRLSIDVDAGADRIVFTVDTGAAAPVLESDDRHVGGESERDGPAGASLAWALASGLARLMGGSMAIVRGPAQGSRVDLNLPLPAADAAEPVAPGPLAPHEGPGRTLKVLVAEADPIGRLYLEAVLGKLAHEAVYTADGEEAVRAARGEDFDIVLMDLVMPVIDGLAVARAIRQLPLPRGAMPIVALTAEVSAEARQRALDAGIDDLLAKPALLSQLHALFARFGGARAPLPHPSRASRTEDDDIVDRATIEELQAWLSPQQYSVLLARFFDAHESGLAGLRELERRGDRAGLWHQAQALRGAALSIGLCVIAERAEALIRATDDAERPPLSKSLDALEKAFAVTRSLCQGLGWLRAASPDRPRS